MEEALSPAGVSGPKTDGRWYAVHCQAHREATALAHLQNQGFEAFLPRRRKTRRHARRFDEVLVPYFPGYLFVKLDIACQPWRSINGTRGVVRLVMLRDRPAPAPTGIIEALRRACDSAGILRLQEPNDLEPGAAVRILSGAFADFVGELDRLDDAGRVRVLLDIMGGRVPIRLSREDVMRADLGV